MKNVSRRDVCVGLPAFAALGSGVMQSQVHASEFPAPQGTPPQNRTVPANDKPGPVTGGGTLGAARAIPMDSIPATATANNGERRQMLHGTLATGEPVELHQSMQNPGTPAPALHVIHHSEMILVREGTLKFQHEVDGKVVEETVGPGGVFYIAYGTQHAVSNAGTTQARYFVVEIGGDV
ncbi:MAG: cupin domain-containing protein [Acidobacteriaceae bacterium]|jgi:mannose-6-phosphate isomerase-like protein (cupin superfamily)